MKFNVGDLIAHTSPHGFTHNLGVVVKIDEEFGRCIKVCWADHYGTFWAQPSKLKLIAKGKNNDANI